jgi:transcriptional regulator with XRE-family HTH domain
MGATFPPPLNSSFFLRIAIVVGYALELKEAAMQPVTAVSFGRWLKERRKLLDLTQDQLARKVGCALITIKKLEADERRPSRHIAERLLEVLAIPEGDQVAFLRLARGMCRDDQVASRGETPLLPANAFPLSGSDHRSIRGYDLREPIGSGSVGAVYRAYQPVVGRDVAIKIVLPRSMPITLNLSDVSKQKRR